MNSAQSQCILIYRYESEGAGSRWFAHDLGLGFALLVVAPFVDFLLGPLQRRRQMPRRLSGPLGILGEGGPQNALLFTRPALLLARKVLLRGVAPIEVPP